METTGIIIGVVILVGLVFVAWVALMRKLDRETPDYAPYKLEPTEVSEPGKYPPLEPNPEVTHETTTGTSDSVAFSNRDLKSLLSDWASPYEQPPKRPYTKRSKYWSTNKPAAKLKKARAAKRKTKSK
jgi:hypothetical protein